MVKKEFKDFTAKVKDADGDEQESTVRARISKGDESVNALGGVRAVNKGDVIIERPDSPGTYDVLTADQWKDTGYSGGNSASAPEPGTSEPAPTQRTTGVSSGTQSSNPTANAGAKSGGNN